MTQLCCPVCSAPLHHQEGSCACPSGHCFDIARQGYVNLLPVQQKHSLHPGDTPEQVIARRQFLEGGFYLPIAQAVCQAAREFAPAAQAILDVGCGEGYYTAQVAKTLPQAETWGLDISKDAVRRAAGAHKDCRWICGTASHLPFPDGSFSLLLSMFSLTVPAEFRRVLSDGGCFLQVLAGPAHLQNLKQIIYPVLLPREKAQPEYPGFRLLTSRIIRFPIFVQGEQVQNLLAMTPHFWRIRRDGAQRLAATRELTDQVDAIVHIFSAG